MTENKLRTITLSLFYNGYFTFLICHLGYMQCNKLNENVAPGNFKLKNAVLNLLPLNQSEML